MPAAAVIPAPIAYIKVVAVKKLVVEVWSRMLGLLNCKYLASRDFLPGEQLWFCRSLGTRSITLKKLECSKQANGPNILAWNNRIGRAVLFCWFRTAVMINRDSRGH